jgi:hypothetical protein
MSKIDKGMEISKHITFEIRLVVTMHLIYCHQKREGPTNNQTPLALLASDKANIRYTHIKGTALATSLIQIKREIHYWSTTDSLEPLQTHFLLRTSRIKIHSSNFTKGPRQHKHPFSQNVDQVV